MYVGVDPLKNTIIRTEYYPITYMLYVYFIKVVAIPNAN